nr:hypothetical protein [uncultured Blautia sp.]
MDKEKKYIGDGIALFENNLGGRICIIPSYIGAWQFAYRSRSWQMKEIVSWLYRGEAPVLLEDSTNVVPFYYENDTEGLLALLNSGLDVQRTKVRIDAELVDFNNKIWEKEFDMQPLELLLFRTRRN